MSTFKRDENFKMDMEKSLKALHCETAPEKADNWKNSPKKALETQRFRTNVLLKQDVQRMRFVYTDCNQKNVMASFERVRREIEDLQWSYVCRAGKHEMSLIPVLEYWSGGSDWCGKKAFINFKTQKGPKVKTVKLTLFEQPPSAVFPQAPRKMCVRLELAGKVPEDLKMHQLFKASMSSGEVFIDFITKKLWPVLEKVDELELDKKLQEAVGKIGMIKEMSKEKPAEVSGSVEKKPEVAVLPVVDLTKPMVQAPVHRESHHQQNPLQNNVRHHDSQHQNAFRHPNSHRNDALHQNSSGSDFRYQKSHQSDVRLQNPHRHDVQHQNARQQNGFRHHSSENAVRCQKPRQAGSRFPNPQQNENRHSNAFRPNHTFTGNDNYQPRANSTFSQNQQNPNPTAFHGFNTAMEQNPHQNQSFAGNDNYQPRANPTFLPNPQNQDPTRFHGFNMEQNPHQFPEFVPQSSTRPPYTRMFQTAGFKPRGGGAVGGGRFVEPRGSDSAQWRSQGAETSHIPGLFDAVPPFPHMQ